MYYTVYRTTNIINSKIYIGAHCTENTTDTYLGSGKILKRAIKKYGKCNFIKEILEIFNNPEDMFKLESELVDETFVKRTDTYNITTGGNGGWSHINDGSKEHIERAKRGRVAATNNGALHKAKQTLSKRYADKNWLQEKAKRRDITIRKKYGGYSSFTPMQGKTHTDEVKRKIGKANSKHQSGEGNSQYGTMWITDGTKNKKIKANKKIPSGWWRGRKTRTSGDVA